MDIKTQIICYLGIYFIFLFCYTYFLSTRQTRDDYLISSRNRGWFSVAMSKYSTSIGASWFITYTAFIYQFGIGVFGAIIGYIISMFILAYYIVPKVGRLSRDKEFLKMGDIVEYKTGSKSLSSMTNILGSAINFGWLLVTLSGGTKLITYFGILDYSFALLSMIGVVLAYTFFSGYKGIVTTDIIQGLIMLIILSIISVEIFGQTEITLLLDTQFDTISMGTVVGFLIFGAFSVFSYIDRYQLIFSGKSNKSLQKGFLGVIPLILLSVFLLLIIGYLVRLEFPGIDPALVFVRAIELYLPVALMPFAIVMFFSAIMSSFDSYSYAIASHLNIFTIKDTIKSIRVHAIVVSLVAGVICYFQRDIVHITVIAAGFSLVLSLPMMYILWGKDFIGEMKNPSRYLFSVVLSLVGLILGIVIIGFEPSIAIVPLLFGGVGLFFSSKKLDELLMS